MATSAYGTNSASVPNVVPVFVNDRVLQALRIQVCILDVRSRPRSSQDLESLFIEVESLLRDLVREAGAA